jgi:hypothetical protein
MSSWQRPGMGCGQVPWFCRASTRDPNGQWIVSTAQCIAESAINFDLDEAAEAATYEHLSPASRACRMASVMAVSAASRSSTPAARMRSGSGPSVPPPLCMRESPSYDAQGTLARASCALRHLQHFG